MKVPKKNIHDTGSDPKNLPGAAKSHYGSAVVAPPSAVKSAIGARHAAHKMHGRHPRGV